MATTVDKEADSPAWDHDLLAAWTKSFVEVTRFPKIVLAIEVGRALTKILLLTSSIVSLATNLSNSAMKSNGLSLPIGPAARKVSSLCSTVGLYDWYNWVQMSW